MGEEYTYKDWTRERPDHQDTGGQVLEEGK